MPRLSFHELLPVHAAALPQEAGAGAVSLRTLWSRFWLAGDVAAAHRGAPGVQDRLPTDGAGKHRHVSRPVAGTTLVRPTIAARLIHFEGPPALAQDFRNWFRRPVTNEAMSHHELAEDNS